MIQYTREQIRSFIRCPQLGSEDYGEWGALRLEQRLAINSMLDQLDSAEVYIRQLEKENKELKEENKNIEYEERIYKNLNPADWDKKGFYTVKYHKKIDVIPKSVIRKKIEEYREKRNKLADGHFWGRAANINEDTSLFIAGEVLKELLGDEDENRN